MRSLASLIALGWFWLAFYGVGPLTTGTQIIGGGLVLAAGCLVCALWGASRGARVGKRRPPRT